MDAYRLPRPRFMSEARPRMRLTVSGVGYVGLTHAVCMADLGHEVMAIDVDQDKIAKVANGEVPFFEPGLEPLLRKNLDTGRLRFTTLYAEVAEFGDVHFLCAGMPDGPEDTVDLRYLHAAADALAPYLAAPCLVVGKSTVPVGTARNVMGRIWAAAPAGTQVDLAWNPEFLREGFAVQDTLRPDRFVFGVTSDWAGGLLRQVYSLPLAAGVPGLVMDLEAAEMVRVSADPFLATKISFNNATAEGCEIEGAGVVQLAEAPAYDERLGRRSRRPGPGLHCWSPEDVRPNDSERENLVVPGLSAEGKPTMRVSVVIPARNEARNLPHVLEALPAGLHEVILVDGHSVDDTIEVAQRVRPDVRIVQQTRRGKGNALACAFAEVTGDVIVMLDADGSADPSEIPAFVAALAAGADFAKGTRFSRGGGSHDITRFRKLGNAALNGLVNLLFGTRYTDLCYGYNAFRAHLLPALDLPAVLAVGAVADCMLWGDGFEIETLINVRVAHVGARITEVGSVEKRRMHGESNLNAFSDGIRVLRTILAERQRVRRLRATEPALTYAAEGLGEDLCRGILPEPSVGQP